jgi:hypothetical protein
MGYLNRSDDARLHVAEPQPNATDIIGYWERR